MIMKLNRITTYMVGAMALLAGCADDDFIDPSHKWDGTIPDELTLTLTIPDPEIVRLGDTRGENGPISTVTLMQYDADGNHLGNIPFEETTLTPNRDQWTLTATLNKETRTLQVVANADVGEATDPSTVVTESGVLEAYTGITDGPILWASAQIAELLDDTNQPEIALQRQAAKLTVAVEDDADFSLSGFLVCGMAEKGTVAPKAANLTANPQKPTVATGVTYTYESSMSNSGAPLYFFEGETATADGKLNSRIILKGIYNGQEYYYVAAFRTRTGSGNSEDPGEYTYTDIPVLRNHWYKLTVEKVRGEGWKTLEEAKTAMPDNRVTVWLEDQTGNITDMVATRDYMLGVSGEVSPEWDAKATISVLAKFADNISDESKQKLKLHLSSDQDWIELTEIQKEGIPLTRETMPIEIALSENASSTDDREGTVTVTLGKLSRTVKIIQQGRPLRRERRAIICGLPGVTGPVAGGIYYYQWLDGTGSEPAPQGMAESQNRGQNRNNALIFTAVPAYELYYKIPTGVGDQISLTAGSSDFSLTTEGGYYIVKAKNTSTPHIAKGELTITNGDGAVLKYDLLQTGYFHKLNPADGNQVAVNDRQASGWFYYEVVRFGNMYILDRNLGASTNASYDPTSISYTPEDDKAIGGYFKVNTGRAGASDADMRKGMYDHETITTVTGGLGMSYTNSFFIPLSENEMKAIGLNGNRGSGSVSLTAEEGYVADGNCIYIPAAGYYYGTSKRNDLHVNLWTRTLLGGTQGLTETDDEYGMNYRILDIFGVQTNYQGLRISSGSGATLKPNLMRYLPLRLVWKSGTNTEIAEGSTTSTPTPPDPTPDTRNIITLMIRNDAGWDVGALTPHIEFYDKGFYKVGENYVFEAVNKVRYENANWFKVEIQSSNAAGKKYLDALNNGGYFNICHTGKNITLGKYYEVANNQSDCAFFYSNSTGYIDKQAGYSVSTTPGWDEGGSGGDTDLGEIADGKARIILYDENNVTKGGTIKIQYTVGSTTSAGDFIKSTATVGTGYIYYYDVPYGLREFQIQAQKGSEGWYNYSGWIQDLSWSNKSEHYYTIDSNGQPVETTKKNAPRRKARARR